MRPVLAVDLLCAGRVLLAVAPDARGRTAEDLVAQADIADWFCRTTGARHPEFGDGTLAAAARAKPLGEARLLCDPEFCRSLIIVLEALIARARRN